jgi:hypothetical protein
MNSLFAIPTWLDLVAVGIGAAQGAMFSSRYRGAELDLLGVAIIGIVSGFGGEIRVESVPGVRTTFSVVLLKGGVATTISSGSFNGSYGYTLTPGTNNRTYRIQFNNATVKFIVDKKLLHKLHQT